MCGKTTEFLFYAERLRNFLPYVAGRYRYRHRVDRMPSFLFSSPNWLFSRPHLEASFAPFGSSGEHLLAG